MLKISEMRSDVMGQFHNALYLGDVSERVKVLEQVGHYPLAYLTAKTHGLEEDASRIAEIVMGSGAAIPDVSGLGKLLQPPAPLLRGDNWPLLPVSKGFFEGVLSGEIAGDAYAKTMKSWEMLVSAGVMPTLILVKMNVSIRSLWLASPLMSN